IGLDPVGARELRAMIGGLTSAGKTILLTTHYMFEADDLCDRIGVIAEGRILATGTPTTLKAPVADRYGVEVGLVGAEPAVIERVRSLPGVTSVAEEDREQAQLLIVQSAHGAEIVDSLLRELDGTRIGRVVSREPTLEDAYVDLVSNA